MKKVIKNNMLKKECGITLVALVVTIIILLILAGVTLNIALSENGIFEKAKEAVEKYKKAEEDEKNVLDNLAEQLKDINIDYNDYVGCYVEGYNLEKKTFTVTSATSGVTSDKDTNGNTISDNIAVNGDQTFETETDMKWRIWDYDGTTIRLISEKPTNTLLSLKGANGYNNEVWALNEICRKCYGQDINGVSVLNLKRSDILNVSTYDITNYSHDDDTDKETANGKYKYGSTIICSNENIYYPNLWKENDRNWNYRVDSNGQITGTDKLGLKLEYEGKNENGYSTGSINTEFKLSVCAHSYKKDELKNSIYYEILFENMEKGRYFLAGRFVNIMNERDVRFAIMFVDITDDGSTNIGGGTMFFINKGEQLLSGKLRPIISINLKTSGYALEKKENSNGKVSFELKKKLEM